MEKIISKLIDDNILFKTDEEKKKYLVQKGYLEEEVLKTIKEVTKFENDILYWSDKLWKISSRLFKFRYKAIYNKSIKNLIKEYPLLTENMIKKIYNELYWRYK